MFDHLLKEIRTCRYCCDSPSRLPGLPHEPRPVVRGLPTARILIAGQAPGTRVHSSGIPFDDPSGVRLRKWMGINPEVFYDESKIAIAPMGFCFPGLSEKGSDLPPRSECASRWRQRLLAQFNKIELTLVIGQYAQKWHLGNRRKKTLTETVAHWADYSSFGIIPLPHPSWRNNAWIRKNPWFEEELLPVLRSQINSKL